MLGSDLAHVDAILKAHPDRPNTRIATETGVGWNIIARRRAELGIPALKVFGGTGYDKTTTEMRRDAVDGVLRSHPEWTNARIVRETGADIGMVKRRREALGVGRAAYFHSRVEASVHEKIEDMLNRSPESTDMQIGDLVGVSDSLVAHRRRQMNIPTSRELKRLRIDEAIQTMPEKSNSAISRKLSVSIALVAKRREALGIPLARRSSR